MQQIEIDFDVWKELTVQRTAEDVSYNDVLRALLGLTPSRGRQAGDAVSESRAEGFWLRDLFLPEGTELRARYKGNLYRGKIVGGRWLDEHGHIHASPSAAANHITGTTVNGWRFWDARRPQDSEWSKIELLPKSRS